MGGCVRNVGGGGFNGAESSVSEKERMAGGGVAGIGKKVRGSIQEKRHTNYNYPILNSTHLLQVWEKMKRMGNRCE